MKKWNIFIDKNNYDIFSIKRSIFRYVISFAEIYLQDTMSNGEISEDRIGILHTKERLVYF